MIKIFISILLVLPAASFCFAQTIDQNSNYLNADFGIKIPTPPSWFLQDISEALQKLQPELKLSGIIITKDGDFKYNPYKEKEMPLPNIQFTGFKIPGMSAELFAAGMVGMLKHNPAVKILGEDKIQLNGREWIVLNVEDSPTTRGMTCFYSDNKNGIAYNYQANSKKEKFDLYKEDFNKILKSIIFLD
ncbi:MAG: hypothetical protein HY209_04920 [Candidatus Omnitrophica bacterium]|nr:hypothetical protein [Candidatus Omnitrophota bacterium]